MGMDSTKRKGPKQFEASKNELYAIFRKRPFSLEKAQRVLSDFQQLGLGNDSFGELCLTFIDLALDYGETNEAGFCDAVFDTYYEVAGMAGEDETLYEQWKDHLQTIRDKAIVSWPGFSDYMHDMAFIIPWAEDE